MALQKNLRMTLKVFDGADTIAKKSWYLDEELQQYILDLIDCTDKKISAIVIEIERTRTENSSSFVFLKYIVII